MLIIPEVYKEESLLGKNIKFGRREGHIKAVWKKIPWKKRKILRTLEKIFKGVGALEVLERK